MASKPTMASKPRCSLVVWFQNVACFDSPYPVSAPSYSVGSWYCRVPPPRRRLSPWPSSCHSLQRCSMLRVPGVQAPIGRPPTPNVKVLDRYTPSKMQGVPSNPTDLRAKPSREADKWQRFHLIKCEYLPAAPPSVSYQALQYMVPNPGGGAKWILARAGDRPLLPFFPPF